MAFLFAAVRSRFRTDFGWSGDVVLLWVRVRWEWLAWIRVPGGSVVVTAFVASLVLPVRGHLSRSLS